MDAVALSMLKERFNQIDKDKSGFLEPQEVVDGLKAMGFKFKKEEIDQMIVDSDANKNGLIEYEEFLKFMEKIYK